MRNTISVLLLKGGRASEMGHIFKKQELFYRNDKLNTFLENCGGIDYNLSGIIVFTMSSLTISLH